MRRHRKKPPTYLSDAAYRDICTSTEKVYVLAGTYRCSAKYINSIQQRYRDKGQMYPIRHGIVFTPEQERRIARDLRPLSTIAAEMKCGARKICEIKLRYGARPVAREPGYLGRLIRAIFGRS